MISLVKETFPTRLKFLTENLFISLKALVDIFFSTGGFLRVVKKMSCCNLRPFDRMAWLGLCSLSANITTYRSEFQNDK